jgi:hypothetical protein
VTRIAVRRIAAATREALSRVVRGEVAAVHPGAAVLRLDDGTVLVLLDEDSRFHPWALVAPFAAGLIATGQPVAGDGTRLEIGTLALGLAAAEVDGLALTARLPDPAEARCRLEVVLSRSGPPSHPPELAAVLATLAAGGPAAPLAALVGLGAGSTPAADDAILGALAGLESAGAGTQRAELAAALPGDLVALTPRLSAQTLSAAVAGSYPRPLLAVLDALTSPEDLPLLAAVAALGSVGHHSGRDTLSGLVAALAAAGSPNVSWQTADKTPNLDGDPYDDTKL